MSKQQCFTSLLLPLIIIHAIDIPIFVYRDEHSDLLSLDISNNISAADLYHEIPHIAIGDALSIGGTVIGRTDTRHIAELSICSESVIHIIHHTPSDAQSLYNFAKDWNNKELIPWWLIAEQCHSSPDLDHCQQHAVCQWADIQCNERREIHSMSLEIAIHRYWACCSNDLALSGKMVLRDLPQSVMLLEASISRFEEVDLRGLQHHNLRSLDLASNAITTIHLGDLRDSKMERLDLEGNAITEVNLSELEGTSLRELFLTNNHIRNIDFRGLNRTKLMHLDLEDNDLRMIRFEGLEGSSLKTLNLEEYPLKYIDFKGFKQSDLRHLLLPFGGDSGKECG